MIRTIWITILFSSAGAIPRNTRQYLVIPADTCRYMPIPADTCRYLQVPVDTCKYLLIPANACWYFLIPVDTCWYLPIPLSTWQYLAIILQYLTIPNNTCQFQTIPNYLVSAGIIWYWQYIKYSRQCNTSITMALSQYDTDSVVSIWYCHGTDSGNFHKTFNAYLAYAEIAR